MEKKWFLYYKEALIYYKKYGNLLVPRDYVTEDGLNLGVWILENRKNKDTLEEKQKEALDSLDMAWDEEDFDWQVNYNLVYNYFLNYGNLKIPKNFKTLDGIRYNENGKNIYYWVKIQRKLYNNTMRDEENRNKYGILSPEKILKLEDIGFNYHKYKNRSLVNDLSSAA